MISLATELKKLSFLALFVYFLIIALAIVVGVNQGIGAAIVILLVGGTIVSLLLLLFIIFVLGLLFEVLDEK